MSLFRSRTRAGVMTTATLCGMFMSGVSAVAADGRPYTAQVSLDRALPERFVSVADFSINATSTSVEAGLQTRLYGGDMRGVQYLVLDSADGTFRMPFEAISEIIFNRSLGRSGDVAHYDATVKLKRTNESRNGRLDLRVLQGSVDSIPWHVLLTSRDDRGANLHRILFVD